MGSPSLCRPAASCCPKAWGWPCLGEPCSVGESLQEQGLQGGWSEELDLAAVVTQGWCSELPGRALPPRKVPNEARPIAWLQRSQRLGGREWAEEGVAARYPDSLPGQRQTFSPLPTTVDSQVKVLTCQCSLVSCPTLLPLQLTTSLHSSSLSVPRGGGDLSQRALPSRSHCLVKSPPGTAGPDPGTKTVPFILFQVIP